MRREPLLATIALSLAGCAALQAEGTRATERMLAASALAPLGAVAVQHHERLDGSGYPRGAGGDAGRAPARSPPVPRPTGQPRFCRVARRSPPA